MRMLSSTPPTPIACAAASVNQAAPHQQNRIWEREPAPLLSAQYETLSDSDDWAAQKRDLGGTMRGGGISSFLVVLFLTAGKNLPSHDLCPETFQESLDHG